MIDRRHPDTAAAAIVDDVRDSNFADLACVVVLDDGTAAPQNAGSFLYGLYSRRSGSQVEGQDVVLSRLENVPRIDTQALDATTIDRIRNLGVDVLLIFGTQSPPSSIRGAARFGVWFLHFSRLERGVGAVTLRMLASDGSVHELSKSIVGYTTGPGEHTEQAQRKAASAGFVIQKLRDVHRSGESAVDAPALDALEERPEPTPGNREMAAWLFKKTRARLARSVQPARIDHWKVGIRKGGPFLDDAAMNGVPFSAANVQWIESPKGRLFADPFLFEHEGRTWLFVEDFDYATQRAAISVALLNDDGRHAPFERCLVLPHHLSFPLVFGHEGDIFLLPESAAGHQLVLYRARRFPDQWVAEEILLEGDFVDTVLWREGQRWWLLTALRQAPAAVHALLFRSDRLQGPWTLHPASPLFNDVRFARNAGPVIQRSGRMFRVSQDCSHQYGYSFWINEIAALTDKEYDERTIAKFTPDLLPGAIATHTYSRCGEWEALDGCFRELRRRVI